MPNLNVSATDPITVKQLQGTLGKNYGVTKDANGIPGRYWIKDKATSQEWKIDVLPAVEEGALGEVLTLGPQDDSWEMGTVKLPSFTQIHATEVQSRTVNNPGKYLYDPQTFTSVEYLAAVIKESTPEFKNNPSKYREGGQGKAFWNVLLHGEERGFPAIRATSQGELESRARAQARVHNLTLFPYKVAPTEKGGERLVPIKDNQERSQILREGLADIEDRIAAPDVPIRKDLGSWHERFLGYFRTRQDQLTLEATSIQYDERGNIIGYGTNRSVKEIAKRSDKVRGPASPATIYERVGGELQPVTPGPPGSQMRGPVQGSVAYPGNQNYSVVYGVNTAYTYIPGGSGQAVTGPDPYLENKELGVPHEIKQKIPLENFFDLVQNRAQIKINRKVIGRTFGPGDEINLGDYVIGEGENAQSHPITYVNRTANFTVGEPWLEIPEYLNPKGKSAGPSAKGVTRGENYVEQLSSQLGNGPMGMFVSPTGSGVVLRVPGDVTGKTVKPVKAGLWMTGKDLPEAGLGITPEEQAEPLGMASADLKQPSQVWGYLTRRNVGQLGELLGQWGKSRYEERNTGVENAPKWEESPEYQLGQRFQEVYGKGNRLVHMEDVLDWYGELSQKAGVKETPYGGDVWQFMMDIPKRVLGAVDMSTPEGRKLNEQNKQRLRLGFREAGYLPLPPAGPQAREMLATTAIQARNEQLGRDMTLKEQTKFLNQMFKVKGQKSAAKVMLNTQDENAYDVSFFAPESTVVADVGQGFTIEHMGKESRISLEEIISMNRHMPETAKRLGLGADMFPLSALRKEKMSDAWAEAYRYMHWETAAEMGQLQQTGLKRASSVTEITPEKAGILASQLRGLEEGDVEGFIKTWEENLGKGNQFELTGTHTGLMGPKVARKLQFTDLGEEVGGLWARYRQGALKALEIQEKAADINTPIDQAIALGAAANSSFTNLIGGIFGSKSKNALKEATYYSARTGLIGRYTDPLLDPGNSYTPDPLKIRKLQEMGFSGVGLWKALKKWKAEGTYAIQERIPLTTSGPEAWIVGRDLSDPEMVAHYDNDKSRFQRVAEDVRLAGHVLLSSAFNRQAQGDSDEDQARIYYWMKKVRGKLKTLPLTEEMKKFLITNESVARAQRSQFADQRSMEKADPVLSTARDWISTVFGNPKTGEKAPNIFQKLMNIPQTIPAEDFERAAINKRKWGIGIGVNYNSATIIRGIGSVLGLSDEEMDVVTNRTDIYGKGIDFPVDVEEKNKEGFPFPRAVTSAKFGLDKNNVESLIYTKAVEGGVRNEPFPISGDKYFAKTYARDLAYAATRNVGGSVMYKPEALASMFAFDNDRDTLAESLSGATTEDEKYRAIANYWDTKEKEYKGRPEEYRKALLTRIGTLGPAIGGLVNAMRYKDQASYEMGMSYFNRLGIGNEALAMANTATWLLKRDPGAVMFEKVMKYTKGVEHTLAQTFGRWLGHPSPKSQEVAEVVSDVAGTPPQIPIGKPRWAPTHLSPSMLNLTEEEIEKVSAGQPLEGLSEQKKKELDLWMFNKMRKSRGLKGEWGTKEAQLGKQAHDVIEDVATGELDIEGVAKTPLGPGLKSERDIEREHPGETGIVSGSIAGIPFLAGPHDIEGEKKIGEIKPITGNATPEKKVVQTTPQVHATQILRGTKEKTAALIAYPGKLRSQPTEAAKAAFESEKQVIYPEVTPEAVKAVETRSTEEWNYVNNPQVIDRVSATLDRVEAKGIVDPGGWFAAQDVVHNIGESVTKEQARTSTSAQRTQQAQQTQQVPQNVQRTVAPEELRVSKLQKIDAATETAQVMGMNAMAAAAAGGGGRRGNKPPTDTGTPEEESGPEDKMPIHVGPNQGDRGKPVTWFKNDREALIKGVVNDLVTRGPKLEELHGVLQQKIAELAPGMPFDEGFNAISGDQKKREALLQAAQPYASVLKNLTGLARRSGLAGMWLSEGNYLAGTGVGEQFEKLWGGGVGAAIQALRAYDQSFTSAEAGLKPGIMEEIQNVEEDPEIAGLVEEMKKRGITSGRKMEPTTRLGEPNKVVSFAAHRAQKQGTMNLKFKLGGDRGERVVPVPLQEWDAMNLAEKQEYKDKLVSGIESEEVPTQQVEEEVKVDRVAGIKKLISERPTAAAKLSELSTVVKMAKGSENLMNPEYVQAGNAIEIAKARAKDTEGGNLFAGEKVKGILWPDEMVKAWNASLRETDKILGEVTEKTTKHHGLLGKLGEAYDKVSDRIKGVESPEKKLQGQDIVRQQLLIQGQRLELEQEKKTLSAQPVTQPTQKRIYDIDQELKQLQEGEGALGEGGGVGDRSGTWMRRMFGGFGLMYLRSITGIATQGLGFGMQERLAMDQAMAQGGAALGIANPIYSQQQVLANRMALGGVNNNPVMLGQMLRASSATTSDLYGAGAAGLGTYATLAWMKNMKALEDFGPLGGVIERNLGPIALAVGAGAYLGEAYSRSQDTKGVAFDLSKIEMFPAGGHLAGPKTLAGFYKSISPNISKMMMSPEERARTDIQEQQFRVAKATWQSGGQLPSNEPLASQGLNQIGSLTSGVVTNAQLFYGKGSQSGDTYTAAVQTAIDAAQQFAPEVHAQATAMIMRAGQGMNLELEQKIAGQLSMGVNPEAISQNMLASAGMTAYDMYKTRPGGDFLSVGTAFFANNPQYGGQAGQAMLQGAAQYAGQIPDQRYTPEAEAARAAMATGDVKALYELDQKYAKLQGTRAGERYITDMEIYRLKRKLGLLGKGETAPNIESYGYYRPTMIGGARGQVESREWVPTEYTAQQQDVYNLQTGGQAQGLQRWESTLTNIRSQWEYLGSPETGVGISNLLEKVKPKNPQLANQLEAVFSGDRIALAGLAKQYGIDLTKAPGLPSYTPGLLIPAEYTAFTDVRLNGSIPGTLPGAPGPLTGLSWGTTSLNIPGGRTGAQLAPTIFGANWQQSAAAQAAVNGVGPNGPLTIGGLGQVGGTLGLQVYGNQLQYQQQMASVGIQMQSIALQRAFTTGVGLEKYYGTINPQTGQPFGPLFQGGEWGLQDAQRRLGYRQQEWQFGFQARQQGLQQQQFFENMGLQQQQVQMQRGWAQQDWSTNRNIRAMQWGWQQEDFQENVRFMTGRDRRLAERQFGRETTMHNVEEEQAKKQESRQKQLWQLEDRRFEMERKHFMENQELQTEALKMSKQFYEERKKLEEAAVKLQRAQWVEQMKLQQQSAGIAADYAKKNQDLQNAMLAVNTFSLMVEGSMKTLKDDGLKPLWDYIRKILEDMGIYLTNNGGEGQSGWSPTHASGADFVVPPGYQNDTYTMRVESGEHVQVTSAAQTRKKMLTDSMEAVFGGTSITSTPSMPYFVPTSPQANPTQDITVNVYVGQERIDSIVEKSIERALQK